MNQAFFENFDFIPLSPAAATEPEGYPQLPPSMRSMVLANEQESISLFEVFPNPAHDFVEVNLGKMALTPEARMEVRDVRGALVYKQEIAQGKNHLLLQLDELTPGMYFVSLIDQDQVLQTQQIVLR